MNLSRSTSRLLLALTLCFCASTASAARKAATGPRIITLAPHLTELVCAVGACNQLVAVGAFSNYPKSVERLPVMGDVSHLNYEFMLKLHPTHVYAWDGGTPQAQVARLRGLGLPITLLKIDSVEGVAEALRRIGNETGHAREGAAAAERYNGQLAALKARYANSRKLSVFYQIETAPAYTVNGQSPISQVIELCGGVNIFADLPVLSAPVSTEAVLARKPDVVLHSEFDRRAIRDYWRPFKSLPMVQLKNIYGINADLVTRAGPRLPLGAEATCEALEAARTVAP